MAKASHITRVKIYFVLVVLIVTSILVSIPRDNFKQNSQQTATPTEPSLKTNTYALRIGEAKMVQGVRFGFFNVESDDRCAPKPCSDTGSATIILRIFQGMTTQDTPVNSATPVYFENFKITLLDLTPTPVQSLDSALATIKIEPLD